MSEYTPMTPEQCSMVEALLNAEQQPVANNVLLSLAESVRDRQEHQHPTHEDIYCGNLTAWAGERTGAVLRRLVDAEREIDRLRAERDELLTELDGRGEEARERWIARELEKTGLRSMDFRTGMSMEIEPAREMVAAWVGAARAMLGYAPNYSETPVEMEVGVGEDPQRYAFVLQRVGRLTPHEARQQAEADQAQAAEPDEGPSASRRAKGGEVQ